MDVHIEREGDQALGWFKVEARSRKGSFAPKLLGEHADWAAAPGGGGAVPGRGGEPAALRRRHSRARDAGRQLLERAERRNSGVGRAQHRSWCGEGAARSRNGEGRRARSRQRAPPEAQAEARARTVADGRVNQPSWSITSATAEAKHIAKMIRAALPPRLTTRRASWRRTRPATAPTRAWRGGR